MSIYKVKIRCTNPNCNNLWIEDVPEDTPLKDKKCPNCGGDCLRLSLYNDILANIDDDCP